MTPHKLLSQNPNAELIDKYTGGKFKVLELTPILVKTMQTSHKEAHDFAERFITFQPEEFHIEDNNASSAIECRITNLTLTIQNLNNNIVELTKTVKSLKESLEKLNVDKNGVCFL